jgi:hypothetical protein
MDSGNDAEGIKRGKGYMTESIDCEHIKTLIRIYSWRLKLLELSVAPVGEEKAPLTIHTEMEHLRLIMDELGQQYQQYCQPSAMSVTAEEIKRSKDIIDLRTQQLDSMKSAGMIDKGFFDRRQEMQLLKDACGDGRVIFIDAPVDYGKTRLLLEFIPKPSNSSYNDLIWIPVSFAGARYRAPGAMLDFMIQRLHAEIEDLTISSLDESSEEELLNSLIALLIELGSVRKKNIILIFENVHHIRNSEMLAWLRDTFIQEVKAQLRFQETMSLTLIISGRFIHAEWDIQHAQQKISLPPFSVSDIEFIIQEKLEQKNQKTPSEFRQFLAIAVGRITGGHPQNSIKLLDHLIDERKLAYNFDQPKMDTYLLAKRTYNQLFSKYGKRDVADILSDLHPQVLRDCYKVLSVFRFFFQGAIEELQKHGLIESTIPPLKIIDNLMKTKYIELDWAYADRILRQVIALQVRVNEPELFKKLTLIAWETWHIRIKRVKDELQKRCVREATYHFFIKTLLEHNVVIHTNDIETGNSITAKLIQQIQVYLSTIKGSFLDRNTLRTQIKDAIIADVDLRSEVILAFGYPAGIRRWETLVGQISAL